MLSPLCLACWDMSVQWLRFQGFEWAYWRIWITSLGDNKCLFYSRFDTCGWLLDVRSADVKKNGSEELLLVLNKCVSVCVQTQLKLSHLYASSVGVQYIACMCLWCVLQSSGWAPCTRTSCNYQSKGRSGLCESVGHDTHSSSLPWRSHFLRDLDCSFFREKQNLHRDRQKGRGGVCDVVTEKRVNCMSLPTWCTCANTSVIADRRKHANQTHTRARKHQQSACICHSAKIYRWQDMLTWRSWLSVYDNLQQHHNMMIQLTGFTLLIVHTVLNYLPQKLCKRPLFAEPMSSNISVMAFYFGKKEQILTFEDGKAWHFSTVCFIGNWTSLGVNESDF